MGDGTVNFTDSNRLRTISATDDSVREVVRAARSEAVAPVLGMITDFVAISGATNRWLYTWKLIRVNASHAVVNTSELWYFAEALNTIEMSNSTTVMHPGITLANLPTGFTVKPISVGTCTMFFPRRLSDTGAIRWVFSVTNVVDGECPP